MSGKIIFPVNQQLSLKMGMVVDVDFSYTTDVQNELNCSVCLTPFVQPLQLSPCEHVICYKCCKEVCGVEPAQCAECRAEITSVKNAARVIVGLLDALEVRCCKCNLVASRDHYANHECTPKPAYKACLEWGTKMNSAGKYDAAVVEFTKRITGFEGTKKLSDKKKKGPDVIPLYEGRALAHLKMGKFDAAAADATSCIEWSDTCGMELQGSVYYIRACAHYGGLGSPKKEDLSHTDLDRIVGYLREAIRRSPDDSLGAKGLLAHLRIDATAPATPPPSSVVATSSSSSSSVESVIPLRGCPDFVLHNSITMLRTYFKQFGKEAMVAYAALSPKGREGWLREVEPFIIPRVGATTDVSGEDCNAISYLCPEININGLCNTKEGLEILMSYFGDSSHTSKAISALIFESVHKIQESISAPGTARYAFVSAHARECDVVDAKTGLKCDTVVKATSMTAYQAKVMTMMRNKKELLWIMEYHRELAMDRLTSLINFLLRVLINCGSHINKTASKSASNVFGCLECGAKPKKQQKQKASSPPVVCKCAAAFYCSKACMSAGATSHICSVGTGEFEDTVKKALINLNESSPLTIDDATTRKLYVKYCSTSQSDTYGNGDQSLLPQIRSVTCDAQNLRTAWASGLDFNPRFNEGNTELFTKAYLGDDAGVKKILAEANSEDKKKMVNFRETLMRFSPLHSCIAGARGKDVFGGGDFVAIAKMLIEAGTDVDAKDFLGFSCVHHCTSAYATNESLQVLLALGDAGADPNAKNRLDEGALFEPTQAQRADVVKALFQVGADPHMKGCYGTMTAMACARMSPTMQQLMFICQTTANLRVGDQVTIQNIQSKPHLNGTTATVTGRIVGKYQIKLQNTDDEIIVKMENLRRVSAENLCQMCKKTCEAPKRCGKCKAVVYCGEACQKKDWPAHKTTCAPPGNVADIVIPRLTGKPVFGYELGRANSAKEHSYSSPEGTFIVKIQVQLNAATMAPLRDAGVRIYNKEYTLDWSLRPGDNVPADVDRQLFNFVCAKGIAGMKAYAKATYSKKSGTLTVVPVALPLPDW